MEKTCYTCKYMGDIPRDVHKRCTFPGVNSGMITGSIDRSNIIMIKKLKIRANIHGIKNGWFKWPINFDPVWLINCDGFTSK